MSMNEKKFEQELINKLVSMGWQYLPAKTNEGLEENFKRILELHNQNVLDKPLSESEFSQIKKIISGLKTPYEAGQFLYGYHGVSQIEMGMDDGRHVFLTVFDQKQVGAGDTVYQVVSQIHRPAVINGKQRRIFDVTLLVNGLPIIQMELKTNGHSVDEALNQMRQYIAEKQYGDIFSTLQILIGITPNCAKYMANTTEEDFNTEFAFDWQRREDNTIVRDWREFVGSMLSIPMAHQMATNYMILDGTENHQMLKVMRPYQVYATQQVIEELKRADFESGPNKIGYIWHTSGSGKTITSFKTAWLASRMPNVDKVVFLVDRVQLTKQTLDDYQAYDPDADIKSKYSVIKDTQNTTALSRKLKTKTDSIIVTSVQKLETLIKRKSFKAPEKNIVFIVDEAHRSTGGDAFKAIQKAFPRAAWVGYTGTPMFEETTTEDIFGPLLHAYTIREAIADDNVLGFKVDFKTTIPEDMMTTEYLTDFYRKKHPDWSEKKIKDKIENLTPEDMDDTIEPSIYDFNPDHVYQVVADIFSNWPNYSIEGKCNALLTTHVGGGKSSINMAMMYYREFKKFNKERAEQGKPTLKVAVTFSLNTSNDDNMLATNQGLHEAIEDYNKLFNTAFTMEDSRAYTDDVASRLAKTASDGNFLDLVIVVDQLLTGFNAPELNTLYVDRMLKGATLIQAYSRTNRVLGKHGKVKGNIVNYRWPAQSERQMNEAFAVYANKDSANLSYAEKKEQNVADGIVAPEFKVVLGDVKKIVEKLSEMTSKFTQLPASEKQKDEMISILKEYNNGIAKLKQYAIDEKKSPNLDGRFGGSEDETIDGFNYNKPDELLEKLGMSSKDEEMLTTVLANELRTYRAKKENIPVHEINFRMSHVKEIIINYDYLTELINKLMNAVHDGNEAEADDTKVEIHKFASGLDNLAYANKIICAANAIREGVYPPKGANFKYPAALKSCEDVIESASGESVNRILLKFRNMWGITDVITNVRMRELFAEHQYGKHDLDDSGKLSQLLKQAARVYSDMTENEEIQQKSKIDYRNDLRDAIYTLADELSQV